jgi:hypothetical protein
MKLEFLTSCLSSCDPIMGICASSHQCTRKDGIAALNWQSTAKIYNSLCRTSSPITQTASSAAQNPCTSTSKLVPIMPQNEELQLGQIYFMTPLSKSQAPLSLQDLCAVCACHQGLCCTCSCKPRQRQRLLIINENLKIVKYII